jgi:hypothetical protein
MLNEHLEDFEEMIAKATGLTSPIAVLHAITYMPTEQLAEKMYYPMKVTQEMLEQALYIRAKAEIALKHYTHIYIAGSKWEKAGS